jgi:hypothetical protein
MSHCILAKAEPRLGRIARAPDFGALDPSFAWLRDYLARVAPLGQLPGRQHIDPAALGRLLPRINIVDVVRWEGHLRFRFRLVGSAQTTAAQREVTGKFIEEAVLPKFVERITSNMRAVVESGQPVYDRFPMPHPEREFIDTERVYFPLAADGRVVDKLLILNDYQNSTGAAVVPQR